MSVELVAVVQICLQPGWHSPKRMGLKGGAVAKEANFPIFTARKDTKYFKYIPVI